jgi:hypothetical protein
MLESLQFAMHTHRCRPGACGSNWRSVDGLSDPPSPASRLHASPEGLQRRCSSHGANPGPRFRRRRTAPAAARATSRTRQSLRLSDRSSIGCRWSTAVPQTARRHQRQLTRSPWPSGELSTTRIRRARVSWSASAAIRYNRVDHQVVAKSIFSARCRSPAARIAALMPCSAEESPATPAIGSSAVAGCRSS